MPVATSFFFNDTATTEIYTLSLHDALPIYTRPRTARSDLRRPVAPLYASPLVRVPRHPATDLHRRSEEHTSELQSRQYLVCRLLLEKKKRIRPHGPRYHPPTSPCRAR